VSKGDVAVKGNKLFITYQKKLHSISFKQVSKVLAAATQAQRENFIVSPSGYGIHWPDMDEDLSIGGLLRDMKVV
jgi:hypothetical protein